MIGLVITCPSKPLTWQAAWLTRSLGRWFCVPVFHRTIHPRVPHYGSAPDGNIEARDFYG